MVNVVWNTITTKYEYNTCSIVKPNVSVTPTTAATIATSLVHSQNGLVQKVY